MREYRNYQRIRARQERTRRAVLLTPIVIVAGALALIASVAHGQAIVDPVCYISAPPVLPQSNPINCLQPRAFMPVVMNAP